LPALLHITNNNLFNEPETRDMNCPVCNNPVDPSKIFCPSCGTRNPGHDKVSMPKEKLLIYIAGGLILVVSLVLVFFLVINPMIINKKATKLYVIANNLKLRSSEYIDVSNSNVIRDVPFGTEVFVFEQNNEWARVKVKKQKGYMGSPYLYLKDKRSFHEIDAIFGNEDSRLALRSTRSKVALLNYFRQNGLFGKVPEPVKEEFMISIPPESIWQVFANPEGVNFNIQADGFFLGNNLECSAIIIQNINSGLKKLLIFSFIEDNPTFVWQTDLQEGYDGIRKIQKSTKLFIGNSIKGKPVLEKIPCDAIEFGSNDVFSVAKKAILIYNGVDFNFFVQP
jgi:hypothetical protein